MELEVLGPVHVRTPRLEVAPDTGEVVDILPVGFATRGSRAHVPPPRTSPSAGEAS